MSYEKTGREVIGHGNVLRRQRWVRLRWVTQSGAVPQRHRSAFFALGRMAEARYTESVTDYPNYYTILGVTPGFTAAALRRAYRTRMLKQRKHPDLGGAADEAIAINEAYAVLKDPMRRAAYDQLYLEKMAHFSNVDPHTTTRRERRRTLRVPFLGHLHVRVGQPVRAYQGQCRDISAQGLSLRTLAALVPKAPITVTFAEDPGMAVDGTVRWRRMIPQRFGHPIYEGGIEFSALHLARFQEFCARAGLTLP